MAKNSIMKQLMENQYMTEHVEDAWEKDRQDYLDARLLRSRPRVFKNYIETNAN